MIVARCKLLLLLGHVVSFKILVWLRPCGRLQKH